MALRKASSPNSTEQDQPLQARFLDTAHDHSDWVSAVVALLRLHPAPCGWKAHGECRQVTRSTNHFSGNPPTRQYEARAYADTRNRKLDYGLSSFDLRHRLIVSWVYELPLGPNRALLGRAHGFLSQAVGAWTLSGITNYRSGFPFTVLASSNTDFSGLNQFSDRVNLRPGVSHVPTDMSNPDHAFDPNVFEFPGAGSVGNVGRNTLIGPQFINEDFAVLKNFPITENRRVQFRAEFFNFFNHTNFKLPENRLDQSGVGKIGDAYDPRLIQFGLRFEW